MTALNNNDKKTVELEDVLKNFKLFGRYQTEKLFLAVFAYMTNSLYSNNYIFAAEEVAYRCEDENFNSTCAVGNNGSGWCTEWSYDNPHTFVGELNLACQDWKRTLVGSAHSFGYMVGLLFVGPLSDRLGRKRMIVITGVIGGIMGLSKSFVTMYWLYVALEFIETAAGDSCSPYFMMTIEMVESKNRILYQQFSSFGYVVGGFMLPLAAYLFPYWRTFLRVIYAPALLFCFYWFLIDESPRWLLSKGKKEQAIAILEKVAKKNKVVLDKSVLEKVSCVKEKETSFLTLIRYTFGSKKLSKRFLVCLVWWTTSTFTNYGIAINSVSLQGNKYVNYALVNAMEIPSTILVMYLLNRFKRRIPLMFSFITAGILCTSQPFVPKSLPWLSILVYMLGKLMSSVYFTITYFYTSELFPTYTRNSMHALCSSLGRTGSIIATQTPLLTRYWSGLPSMIFGTASLVAGLVTLLVPDTANDALPDNVKQAEAMGKHKQKDNETIFVISSKDLARVDADGHTRF